MAALMAGRIDAGFLRATAAPPGIRLRTLLTESLLAGLPGDHFVSVTGHRLTLQLAWSADDTNPALPRLPRHRPPDHRGR